MDGAYKCFVTKYGADVVTDFARKYRESAQQRLAKIANGADPRYINGKKLLAEYRRKEPYTEEELQNTGLTCLGNQSRKN